MSSYTARECRGKLDHALHTLEWFTSQADGPDWKRNSAELGRLNRSFREAQQIRETFGEIYIFVQTEVSEQNEGNSKLGS